MNEQQKQPPTQEDVERQTILAALRSGLGLTRACQMIRKHPKEISEYIFKNLDFHLECERVITSGQQSILVMMNTAINDKALAKWKTQFDKMNSLVWMLNTWECIGNPKEFDFAVVSIALRRCKTLSETSTSMGMTEAEFLSAVYKNQKLAIWMVQNGFQI